MVKISVSLRTEIIVYTLRSPTTDEWCAWAVGARVDSRVVSFIRSAPSRLSDKVEDVLKAKDQGFACCRTWTDVSDLVREVQFVSGESMEAKNNKLRLMHLLAAGRVGEGHARAFADYARKGSGFNVEALLADPSRARGLDLDKKWAAASAMAEVYRSSPNRLDAILSVLHHLDDDFAVAALRMVYEGGGREGRHVFAEKVRLCRNSGGMEKFMRYLPEV
jgi:hypothetical protein